MSQFHIHLFIKYKYYKITIFYSFIVKIYYFSTTNLKINHLDLYFQSKNKNKNYNPTPTKLKFIIALIIIKTRVKITLKKYNSVEIILYQYDLTGIT